MAKIVIDSPSSEFYSGPLFDSGAPYSEIGIVELRAFPKFISPEWNGKLDDIPEFNKETPFWQYFNGAHSSKKRETIDYIFL